MELEIKTTKKKISKSIIDQMQMASAQDMKSGVCLGYVIGCKKDSYKTAIIQHGDDYFSCNLSWKKGDMAVYRKIGKWNQSIKFGSEERYQEWWDSYEKMKVVALENHIYL